MVSYHAVGVVEDSGVNLYDPTRDLDKLSHCTKDIENCLLLTSDNYGRYHLPHQIAG
jgi:hypothetical protein